MPVRGQELDHPGEHQSQSCGGCQKWKPYLPLNFQKSWLIKSRQNEPGPGSNESQIPKVFLHIHKSTPLLVILVSKECLKSKKKFRCGGGRRCRPRSRAGRARSEKFQDWEKEEIQAELSYVIHPPRKTPSGGRKSGLFTFGKKCSWIWNLKFTPDFGDGVRSDYLDPFLNC